MQHSRQPEESRHAISAMRGGGVGGKRRRAGAAAGITEISEAEWSQTHAGDDGWLQSVSVYVCVCVCACPRDTGGWPLAAVVGHMRR